MKQNIQKIHMPAEICLSIQGDQFVDMSSPSKFLSDSPFRLALTTSLPHAALAWTPELNFTNTLDILGRDLKAFCGDSSSDFFWSFRLAELTCEQVGRACRWIYNKHVHAQIWPWLGWCVRGHIEGCPWRACAIWALPSLAQRPTHTVKHLSAARASQSEAAMAEHVMKCFMPFFKEK